MIEAPEIFSRIYEQHGHRCPMSTLGGRLGLAVLALDSFSKQGLRAIYHSRTCALDGIALTTGCCEEQGSMTVTTEGRHVLELFTADGQVAELSLTDNAMQIAGDYRRLSHELEQGWDQLDDAERSERDQRREAALDAALPGLWNAPMADLMTIRTGLLTGDVNA